MATGHATVTINFGAFPGSSEASVTFADAAIGAASKVEAYIMADGVTGTHTAEDHRWLALFAGFSGMSNGAGAGGTIYARCADPMTGEFQIRVIWAD